MEYRENATACEGTCRDLEFRDNSCEEDYIPGCMCPQGEHLDDTGLCVTADFCTCYDQYAPEGKKIIMPGDKVSRKCTEW